MYGRSEGRKERANHPKGKGKGRELKKSSKTMQRAREGGRKTKNILKPGEKEERRSERVWADYRRRKRQTSINIENN